MNRSLALALLLTSCAPATAQLQVVAPTTVRCAPETTQTPVLGIAVASTFQGDNGYSHAGAVGEALKAAGFKVFPTWEFELLDKASVSLEGRMGRWQSRSGDSSSRIGAVSLTVTDLSTEQPLLTLKQDAAPTAFQAPTLDAFMRQLLVTLSGRFCQG